MTPPIPESPVAPAAEAALARQAAAPEAPGTLATIGETATQLDTLGGLVDCAASVGNLVLNGIGTVCDLLPSID